MTVKEAAQYVGVHPNTVYAAAKCGRLRFRAVGRLRRFTIDDLDAWTRGEHA
jgi:excisionase family DNA binding protein